MDEFPPTRVTPQQGGSMHVSRVLETCLYADNLAETAAFYADVLGMSPFAQVEQRHVFFRCGDSVLLLFNPVQTARAAGDVPAHGAFGQGHVAFAITPQSIVGWREHLQSHGVAIEAEIVWPGGGQSLYLRDPAGNSVELTTPKTWGLTDHSPGFDADYLRMLDLLPVGVCFVDPASCEIRFANSSAATTLDKTVQTLIGTSLLDHVQPHRRQEIWEYLRHIAAVAPKPEFFDEHIELASGRHADLEIAAGMLDFAGHAVIQVAFRDVTDRTTAEAALRESEALFRSLAETTDAAIFLFRGSHNIHVNAAACKITGYGYHELVAMPFWQVLHPDFRDLARERGVARQYGEVVPSNYEVAIVTKEGETRWLQYAGNVIDYQGQPAVLGTAIDITARKEIEQALQETEARFRTVAQVSPASITVHVDDRLIYANPATVRLIGYSEEELKEIDFWSLLRPGSLETMKHAYARMMQGESMSGLKLQVMVKDGSTMWMDVYWSPFDLRGKVAWVITAYDVTALVEAEKALRSHARRLETLSEIDRLGLLAMSRQEVAVAALDLIRNLIPYDQASIVETESTQRSYIILATNPHFNEGLQPGRRFKSALWKSIPDDLAHGVYAIADLASVVQWTPFQKVLRRMGLRSYISVPLVAQHKLLGLLTLASRQPGFFDPAIQTAALEVARRVAMVLHNAQLFDELEGSHRRLEELSRRLVQVQETERRAIARELHDEVGQTLTALSIHLELAAKEASQEQLDHRVEAQRLVEDLAGQVRRMSLDLRPPILDDLGLLPTLLWYFQWVAEQYRLDVAFEHHGIERRFDADIETAIFRIVQEAVTNVARHAQTPTVSVRLWADSATLSAQIEDKGQGFDPGIALKRNNSGGLRGMQERARLLGGKFVIEARPGSGACLTALLPLKGAQAPVQGAGRA
jgi:PAS domain S-box-containing protein